jgi:hypothetical protein
MIPDNAIIELLSSEFNITNAIGKLMKCSFRTINYLILHDVLQANPTSYRMVFRITG